MGGNKVSGKFLENEKREKTRIGKSRKKGKKGKRGKGKKSKNGEGRPADFSMI
jgi:hypothetical protein